MINLSFIVPVYNVAPFLRKCVESLIEQDYSDYEIILVDDGSTDESGALCEEIARANDGMSRTAVLNEPHTLNDGKPLIRVIHQENGGLSAARNAGIKAAEGKYICFVDSDDYWEENVLGGLMAQVERDSLDVLRFDFRNVNERYEEFYPNKDPKRDVDYSELVVDGVTFLNERLGPMCYAVMFVIKRNLIISDQKSAFSNQLKEKDNCLFTEGIYFEDTDWTPRMLVKAKRVASTSKIVYNYLWRNGSITLPTEPAKRKKVLEDKIRLIRGFQEQSKFVKDPIWFTLMTSSTAMGVLGMLAKMPFAERKLYLQELKSLHIFPLYTKKEKMLSHKIKTIMANISPNFYCTLMSLRK